MGKIRLLLADDHKMVREGLKAFFAPTDDFEVVAEAANGLEAVEKADQTLPDVILLDLVMPKKDGFEVLEELQKQKNKRGRGG